MSVDKAEDEPTKSEGQRQEEELKLCHASCGFKYKGGNNKRETIP